MQALHLKRVAFSSSCPARQRAVSRGKISVRAETSTIPEGFTQVTPKGTRVLVKVAAEETQTRGGILLPASAIKKPTSGEVVSLGDGRTGEETREFYLKEGDTVLYSKFGFMYLDLKLNTEDYILIREDDVIAIMPRSNAQGDDIPEMKPLGDRVLILVEEVADVTMGGVILPESAKERPLIGTVVRTGPGKYDKDVEGSKRKAMTVSASLQG
ncbi:MAG: hypothetical protein WDW38_001059 [Sanguina aurantia]